MKAKLKKNPFAEAILIASTLFYWVSTSTVLNPIAIVLLLFLIVQIVFNNRYVGLSMALIVLGVGFYMVLALLSEVGKFPSFSVEARTMLLAGSAWLLLTISAAPHLIYRSLKLIV